MSTKGKEPARPPSPSPSTELAAREREAAEQASLPYKWTQTISDLDITIPVPAGTKGRDLSVSLTRSSISVGLKSSTTPILAGSFPHAIHTDESTWTLETTGDGGKEVSVHVDKANKMEWWAHVVTTAPKIDTAKITPENSKLSDLDGETRAMVEKMMFDQRQKELGRPTSDEAKKLEMLERFKMQHPEMDFSNAKMG